MGLMSARVKEWSIRLALTALVPLVVIAIVEAALRMAGAGYDSAFWTSVAGRSAVATNDDFGRRFFPRSLVRTPVPEIVSNSKPARVRRVFLLGESAAMGFPEPGIGLAPVLEHILRDEQPGVEWQVYNAAMTAINSHVILPIGRECARLSPDLFIVLAGNNEAVGPFGPATVFGRTGMPLSVVRSSIWLGGTRSGQVLAQLLEPEAPREWRGLEMFVEKRLSASDPRLRSMHDTFARNMRDIVRTGRQAGAEVILMTVPVNLSACPPFASAEPDSAVKEYRTAEALLASGNSSEALAHFRRARDLDQLRFRADSTINDIIRRTAASEKVRVVDAETDFGLAGGDLFWEHVHFTPAGTYRLAVLLAREIGASHIPDYQKVRQDLPITDWDERGIRLHLAALLGQPPFTMQTGNRERIARLRQQVRDSATTRAEALPAFRGSVARRPDDIALLGRYAHLLREDGDPEGSAAVLARMLQLVPGRKAWHIARGAALSDAGRQDAAITEHTAALAIDDRLDLAHFGLGVAKSRSGQHDQAVSHYSDALRINPFYAEARYNLAGSLATLGRTQAARQELEKAVELKPDFAAAHAALGQLMVREGQIERAIHHYQLAVAGEGSLPEASYDLGVLLARVGRLDEAIRHYQDAVRLRPAYAEAWNNLGIALAKRGQPGRAAAAFERALTANPAFETALANLRRLGRAALAKRN